MVPRLLGFRELVPLVVEAAEMSPLAGQVVHRDLEFVVLAQRVERVAPVW